MPGDEAVNPPHTVQLRHELPDGSWHIDWLLDLDPTRKARLTTFRLSDRVDRLRPGDQLVAERIADHRRVYLTREGPLGQDRGHVERLAEGRFEAMQSLGSTWALVICWESSSGGEMPLQLRRQTLHLRPQGGTAWIVVNGGVPGAEDTTNVLGS